MKIASTTYYSASSKLLLSKSLHDYTLPGIYEMDVDFCNIIGPYLKQGSALPKQDCTSGDNLRTPAEHVSRSPKIKTDFQVFWKDLTGYKCR